ncbi:hypothetical protein [Rhodococcus opacus]|uniref:hypothetical protein n=1 Tax=Rhodococcus opacus TaxID=37919 RepID=UPI000B1CEBC2|nr:hypothetical protein [Rhodococcus opacus]
MTNPGDANVVFDPDAPRRIVPHIPFPPNVDSDPGVELPFTATLLDSPGLEVSVLSPLHIYPSGLYITISWRLRRVDDGFDAARTVLHNLSAARRIETPTDRLPTIEIDCGNEHVLTTQKVRPDCEDTEPTTDSALIFEGMWWSLTDEGEYHYKSPLWVWPLPPANALTLTVAWPALDMQSQPVRLDGASIVSAAAEYPR